jgi:hypothetical protein
LIPTTENRIPKTGVPRTQLIWLAAISIVIFGMVWLTLAQIRSIAIDHGPTQDEIAECRAGLPSDQQAEWTEHCETEPRIIWAARHPLRNSLGVLALLLVVGYLTLLLNDRGPRPPDRSIPRL